MLHLSSPNAPGAPAQPVRRVLVNSWPKAGTHLLLELARLAIGDGDWYAERDIKYPGGDADFVRQAEERVARHAGRSLAIKGHFGRTPGIEAYLAATGFAHLFAVRDPREVLCSTWRWLRDLRPDWAISRHLAPLDPATQLETIIRGLPLLPPFDVDRAVHWERPLPERYAELSGWLDSPDCEVLAYEDLAGMRGVPAQFAAVARALHRMALPAEHTDIARIAGLICNPSAATFHTGPGSDWQTAFSDHHRHLFVELGGEALVERLGYPPTLPGHRRRPHGATRPMAHTAAATAIDPGDDLRAFVDQLAQGFDVQALLQLEFQPLPEVSITAHEAGAATALCERIAVPGDYPRLPLADQASDLVFNLGSLAVMDDFELSVWLPEIRRVTRHHLWVALEATPGRDRRWWETQFIAAGFRKHALSQRVVPYELLNDEGSSLVLLFEPMAARVLHAHPPTPHGAGAGLDGDMLREVGPHAEAQLARYTLARDFLRPGQTLLDVACGAGGGCAVLATGTGVQRVMGVDPRASAIRRAQDLHGTTRAGLEFRTRSPAQLTGVPDASVDVVTCFDPPEPPTLRAGLLQELARVLKPGGLFIGSTSDGTTRLPQGPGPWPAQIPPGFEPRRLYRQDGAGRAQGAARRVLRVVDGDFPGIEDRGGAVCWVAVAAKPVSHAAQTDLASAAAA